MPNGSPYLALASDYDGTLTAGDRPAPEVLDAIVAARARGVRVLLVTGRRLPALLALMPDALLRFDAVVAENGAVLARAGGSQALAPPVPEALARALAARGVPLERGEVLLATGAEHAPAALAEIERLGLEVQLSHNRGALMLLPAGVTKGTGLFRALGELGISYHNAVAVGDAENDHSMFEVCELAVAVANAVPSLQAHADVVLSRAAGAGILELLSGPIFSGALRVTSRRLRIDLGEREAGGRAWLPASPSNILIAGASGSGKSYMAGLVAERLLRLDYAICLLDPEGDYSHLAGLRGLARLGGPAPDPAELGRLLGHRFGSVAFDTSEVPPERRGPLCTEALRVVAAERARRGSPHWLVADEAHLLFCDGHDCEILAPEAGGLCLVTYHPEDLCPRLRDSLDATITTIGEIVLGRALLSGPLVGCPPISFQVAPQALPHVRHRHKYAEARLPPPLRFYFRSRGVPTGRSAANLHELVDELGAADDGTLQHHLWSGDFSRWIGEVIRDDRLAAELRRLERSVRAHAIDARAAASVAARAVERRYLESG